ncbi:MAG TPA: GNAT family N-acetyltransferase [Candidatus Limnocylindria bacterium]|nr:GNAT family N-acetyltransferase [Candidatus Limnocylindria bacterium]
MEEADRLIRSERLELVLLGRDQLERLAAGDRARLASELQAAVPDEWVADVRGLAALRARQLDERPADAPWLLRAIVRTDPAPRAVIGYLNFHSGPNEAGMVEIGYTLLPSARGRGYAIEAVRGAFDWASRAHDVHRFRASVSPDNERSLNLIGKLGFVQTGEQWDPEDGRELVFELDRWTPTSS